MIEKINAEKFDELVKGDKPVVCDFYADWCGPCKMLGPVLEELADIYADKAVFVKVNVDDNYELSARYGIMSIPYVGVFKNGEMTDKSVGYMPKSEAEQFIEKNL